jgi:pilus assembly protein CpaB
MFEAAKQSLYKGIEMIDVVAAAQDLPAGTVLTMRDLGSKKASTRGLGDKAVLPDKVRMVIGKKLLYALKKEDTLLWSYVDIPYTPAYGLAPMIKPGLRAVSISVGGAAAVSGLIQPNDRVDVLGTFSFPSKRVIGEMEAVTLTILQDVTVLATGQNLARQQGSGLNDPFRRGVSGYTMVTFEVTPREAELLVFAEHLHGKLTLTLRHPEDISYESSLPEVDFEQLEKKLPELNLFRQKNIRHKQDL